MYKSGIHFYQPGASSIAFWSWENLALMSSDLCFWNRDEEDDQQSPHWRKKETIKESRFFHLYFVDSKGCLFFNLVPPFTTFLKEERAQYVFILSFLMLLQREKSTKNKLLKKWQICSNNNKKKSGSKKLTSVTGVVFHTFLWRKIKPGSAFIFWCYSSADGGGSFYYVHFANLYLFPRP